MRVEKQILVEPANPALSSQPMADASRLAILGRIGHLEVRLARDFAEVRAAQKVRFDVFFKELGANQSTGPSGEIDADAFDESCDHLIVLDQSLPGPDLRRIVGTYRLLRQDQAIANGGFYSEGEFELSRLVGQNPGSRFLELGRSCVLPEYRSKRTIELLWQGIYAYLTMHSIDVMVGCASFHGTVPALHAQSLSYLAQNCRAIGPWAVRAVAGRYHTMDLMPPEAIDQRTALVGLPPLIKGYLRVGARVGDGCVIDHEFGTVDVFIVMPVKAIGARYINYYGGEGQKLVA